MLYYVLVLYLLKVPPKLRNFVLKGHGRWNVISFWVLNMWLGSMTSGGSLAFYLLLSAYPAPSLPTLSCKLSEPVDPPHLGCKTEMQFPPVFPRQNHSCSCLCAAYPPNPINQLQFLFLNNVPLLGPSHTFIPRKPNSGGGKYDLLQDTHGSLVTTSSLSTV